MTPRPQYGAAEVAIRRSAILESAIDQIGHRGVEAVRMKDIAEAAGVSVGTVQYYFGSRDELLVQAFSAHSSSVVSAIAALSHVPGTAGEKLQASLHAVPRIADLRRRSQVWIELVAGSGRNDYLRAPVDAVFTEWGAHFRELITAGIDDGSFRPQADVDLIVDTLVAAIDGFDLAVAAGRSAATPVRIAASLELIARALLGIDGGDGSSDGSDSSGSSDGPNGDSVAKRRTRAV